EGRGPGAMAGVRTLLEARAFHRIRPCAAAGRTRLVRRGRYLTDDAAEDQPRPYGQQPSGHIPASGERPDWNSRLRSGRLLECGPRPFHRRSARDGTEIRPIHGSIRSSRHAETRGTDGCLAHLAAHFVGLLTAVLHP